MAVAVGLRQGPEHPVLGGDGVGGGGAGGAVVPGEDHHGPAVVETGGQQEVVLPETLDYVTIITATPPLNPWFPFCLILLLYL